MNNNDKQNIVWHNLNQKFIDLSVSTLINVEHAHEGILKIRSEIPLPNFNLHLATHPQDDSLQEIIKQSIVGTTDTIMWEFPEFTSAQSLQNQLTKIGGQLRARYYLGFQNLEDFDFKEVIISNDTKIKLIKNIDGVVDWMLPQAKINNYNQQQLSMIQQLYEDIFCNSDKFHLVVAYQNNHPVFSALLYIDAQTAGLYNACAIPEVRHHGISTHSQKLRMKLAKELGCKQVILQASEMCQGLCIENGFEMIGEEYEYIFSPKDK